jgi:hypothetical protein
MSAARKSEVLEAYIILLDAFINNYLPLQKSPPLKPEQHDQPQTQDLPLSQNYSINFFSE